MGQYYRAVIETKGKRTAYSTYVDGEYMMAKLMEHSYWANPYVLAVASKLWRTKGRLAWVGDYADESDSNWNDAFSDAYKEGIAKENLKYNGFRLEDKCFINHDKKLIIDLDRYADLLKDQDMIINPVSLLTAVGNGKGGGDFHSGKGLELIGTWAWDIVEITDINDIYDWEYNRATGDWDVVLKKDFAGYTDVTKDHLFIED